MLITCELIFLELKRRYSVFLGLADYFSPDHFSDHFPIHLDLTMQVSYSRRNYKKYKCDVEIADWSNNVKCQFYENTCVELSQMSCIDLCCTNNLCSGSQHRNKIDEYITKFTTIIQNCRIVKTVSKDGFEAKSFWTSNLSDLNFSSIESHKLWVNAGKPKCGSIWDLYKKEKFQYKIGVKQARRKLDKRKGDVMKLLLNKNNSKSFWKEKNNKEA